MRVENLQAETTITENGARVYSPNNKPSASDIGALPLDGKPATSGVADTSKTLEAVDNRYVKPNTTGTANQKCIKPFFVDNSTFPSSGRPAGTYSDLLVLDTYGDGSGGRINAIAASKGNDAIYHVQGNYNSDSWSPAAKIYTSHNKPTAADVGAHPTSWKPVWKDVQGKPQYALRWPSWNEISGKPGSMPPNSHTHPWSQITGEPVYTQRWPNWNEVSGKPGNLLTQTTADTRYMSKTAKPDANTLDGQDSSFYRKGMLITQKTINVGGNANTYYPVVITGSAYNAWGRYNISRGYGEPAPNSWNSSTHRGGLTFSWEATGDTAWGGNDKNFRVLEFEESYTTMVAGMALSTSGMIVWLRGGNARYHVTGPVGVGQGVTVYLGNYTSSDKKVWVPRTNVNGKGSEIIARQFVRGSGQLYDLGNRVYSASNKPSAGDVGAYTKGEADGRYLGKNGSAASIRSHGRVTALSGSTVPPSGVRLIEAYSNGYPDTYGNVLQVGGSGSGEIFLGWSGTSGGHAPMYIRSKRDVSTSPWSGWARVYTTAQKPTLAELGAQATLSPENRRKITYGTGNPSGGASGDIYIQYK
ncbi:tail fiber protein [Vibrio phage IW18]|nr:tail fiber protein [Vibrio phage IW18]